MKRIQIITLLTFGVLHLTPIIAQNALFKQANESYNKKDYGSAISSYHQLIDKGYKDAVLYYNLGNAYFKNEQLGNAVLWYERALRLSPDNKDIQYNLAFANQQTTDRIESIPPFFLKTWILSVQNLFSAKQWAVFSLFFCALLVISILLIVLISNYKARMTFFFLACAMFLFTILSIVFAGLQTNNANRTDEGIVIQNSASIKSMPDDAGTDLFTVHEGTKVKITDRVGEWLEVQFSNGSQGWVLSEGIEVI